MDEPGSAFKVTRTAGYLDGSISTVRVEPGALTGNSGAGPTRPPGGYLGRNCRDFLLVKGDQSRFIMSERRSCDSLPSKQAVTRLKITFLYRMRRRSVPKKSVTDGSPNSLLLPSTHSRAGKKGSALTVSCFVLEQIFQVAWISDRLSKELSPCPFRREKYLFKRGEETVQRYCLKSTEPESPLRHLPISFPETG